MEEFEFRFRSLSASSASLEAATNPTPIGPVIAAIPESSTFASSDSLRSCSDGSDS